MAIHHGPAFRLARESARIFGRADEISRKTTFFERHLETPSGMSDLKPASGRAIRRQIEWTPACVLLVVLGTLTSALHVYIGLRLSEVHFLLLGAGLFAGVVVFFTVFWRPILHLVGVIYITVLLIVWLLDGMRLFLLGFVDGVVQLCLIATLFYHFLKAHRRRVT